MSTAKALVRDVLDAAAVRLGWRHSEARLAEDAHAYWATGEGDEDTWRGNSHFVDGSAFQGDRDRWAQVGQQHLHLFRLLYQAPYGFGRVVEWGCGGGANAIAFAPLANREFVGVDINRRTLAECERQVRDWRNVSPDWSGPAELPFRGVLADVARPEEAAAEVGAVDLYLSFYVLELVPSPAYGLHLMELAYEMLTPGGVAFVQIKYDTGSWRTRSRLRGYRASTAAGMTTYRIEEFWEAMDRIGFTPEAVHLVPRNELDERYAYFLLSKEADR